MKYIALTLFICFNPICFLALTGLSVPVENEQILPPIGGPLNPVYPVFLSLVKDNLLKAQDNLRADGKIKEALQLSKFVEEGDQFLKKIQEGVLKDEALGLENYLDGVHKVLEKNKDYLSVEKTDKLTLDEKYQSVPLNAPTNEELLENLRLQLSNSAKKLEARQYDPRAWLLRWYERWVQYLQNKKNKFYLRKGQLDNLISSIYQAVRQIYGQSTNSLNNTESALGVGDVSSSLNDEKSNFLKKNLNENLKVDEKNWKATDIPKGEPAKGPTEKKEESGKTF